jgi:hypothetical protein
MYSISEKQIDALNYIFQHLIVTGPAQGGLLYKAADILEQVKLSHCPDGENNKEDK